jgi:hypothetical protein
MNHQMKDIDTTTNGAVLRRLSCIGLAAWLWTVCQPAMANTDLFEAHFTDNQAALSNPGMGWYIYFYDGPFSYATGLEPSDDLADFPGITVVYLRLPWSLLEPEEGRFNWTVLDTPMQRWVERGKQVAFRVTCCESSLAYATPQWVRQAGAKGHEFKGLNSKDPGPQWEPDYNDPVFLRKLGSFLRVFADRYDGHPDVAFIDIGSFGVWGECHTWRTSGLAYDYPTVRKHVELHCDRFQKTQLVISDDCVDSGRGMISYIHARNRGVSLRDDSILVGGPEHPYSHQAMAQDVWPTMPVNVETLDYPGLTPQWDGGRKFLQAVEDYHASYASIHGEPRRFLKDNRELVQQINLRLGYRLQLLQASWPKEYTVEPGASMAFTAVWRNAGVAPCLPGGFPAVTLKDAKGGVAAVFVDPDFDVSLLPIAEPDKAGKRQQQMTITALPKLNEGLLRTRSLRPFLASGEYDVYISVGTAAGKPTIELPLDNSDGRRRYRIGKVTIKVPKP